MPYLTEFITVAIVHLLAVISPGPDFALVSKNSLINSRKAGIMTAIGLGLGITVHVTYSLIGIGLIISQSILLFSIIKYIGAGYLIYIGLKALKSKKRNPAVIDKNKNYLSSVSAVKVGFLTNVLNPKATLFFLALFTQVINPETPLLIQVMYGAEMAFMTFAWFAGLALILSHHIVKKTLDKIMHRVEHLFGAILIALGIKIALSDSK